jgi:hypothetical protein
MSELTSALVGRACRIFLTLSYPGGEETIPAPRRHYLHVADTEPLEGVLATPTCQSVADPAHGACYALRLGSATYPNLKMKIVDCDRLGTWVFEVETHDHMLPRDPYHADAARIAVLQAQNSALKERIEAAWEAAGVQTFNALLRSQIFGPH